MPKPPTHELVWVSESASYELWKHDNREFSFQAGDDVQWQAWLETHMAFSFHGQAGHMNMLKERRQRGGGYWYAYRSLGKCTVKRYLGPTVRVTPGRLEEVAGQLRQELAAIDAHTQISVSDAKIPQEIAGRTQTEHISLISPLSLKFHPPRLRIHLVERPGLVQLLEDSLTSGLTLISAPAGFGKTTLVSQWLASLRKEGPVVAWVSLDESDNHVVRFWHGVVSACREMLSERAQMVLGQLVALGRSPLLLEASVLELVLTTFLNELATGSGHGIIILEDYHFITMPQIHTSLSFWLEHLPLSLHVVMMTRNDPPLPLAQWRVRGMLHEIRRSDLSFTDDEAACFFRHNSKYSVSDTEMTRLLKRTEGWIAGIQLTVLMLNGQGTEATTSSDFQGAHRYVADYLIQEVLNRLPESVQLFLLQTSLLERLQGRLCEAITGQSEGQNMLEWLEQANLFLIPLDETRQWYRYHYLFREVLRQRLAHRAPEDIAELHRRACHWFRQERMAVEAVAHAHAARDFAAIADIIEQNQSAMLQRGENTILVSWMNLLPQATLFERPSIFFLACMENMAIHRIQVTAELLNTYAYMHQLPAVGTGDVDALEHAFCEHTRKLFPPQQKDNREQTAIIYGFLGFYATLTLVMERNLTLYQQIRQRSEHYAPATRLRRQESWLVFLLQGDIPGAIADLMEKFVESTTRQGDAILFAYLYPTLKSLLIATGQLQVVESTAQRILQRQDTLDARLNQGPALIDQGMVAYERDQLKRAEASIQAGIPLCKYPGFEAAHCQGLFMLAKVKRAQGESNAARTLLQELKLFLSSSNFEPGTLKNWCGLLAWGMLDLGDVGYARLWLRDNLVAQNLATHFNPLSANMYLMQAFFLWRFERRAEAETLLSELSTWAKQLDLYGTQLHILAFQALLAQAKGETGRAETALKEALTLAEALGYARTFLDMGEEMRALLIHLWNQRDTEEQSASVCYLAWLVALARGHQTTVSDAGPAFPQPLIEPLSPREMEVLRAINEGYSNLEIARHLVIAPSTVKSHINSIYRKLKTKSRTQTIAQAHTLHLFPR